MQASRWHQSLLHATGHKSMHEELITYGDSQISDADRELLREPEAWLNDACISFLLTLIFADDRQVAFITPAVVHLAVTGNVPIQIPNAEMVLIPVNDCDSDTALGGSHWSLLVFHPARNGAVHYDSAYPLNVRTANRTLRRMLPTGTEYWEGSCTQQGSSGDCGVHVILNALLAGKRRHVDLPAPRCSMKAARQVLDTAIDVARERNLKFELLVSSILGDLTT